MAKNESRIIHRKYAYKVPLALTYRKYMVNMHTRRMPIAVLNAICRGPVGKPMDNVNSITEPSGNLWKTFGNPYFLLTSK